MFSVKVCFWLVMFFLTSATSFGVYVITNYYDELSYISVVLIALAIIATVSLIIVCVALAIIYQERGND